MLTHGAPHITRLVKPLPPTSPALSNHFPPPHSAPVKLVVEGQRDEDLTFLMANDSDPFNRWESGQRLTRKLLLKLYEGAQGAAADAESVAAACTAAGGVPDGYVDAVKALLTDPNVDGSFKVCEEGV